MRVFVTGATGFIGSAVVQELLNAGHEVVGLARSADAEAALLAAGADVHRGDAGDPESLARGAAAADGVIHTAFNHDFRVNRLVAAAADRLAIVAIAEALEGSGRPLVITSGTGVVPGQVVAEDTPLDPQRDTTGRYANEIAALSYVDRGVRASIVKFPRSVHGHGDKNGLVPALIAIARRTGVAAYPGEGANRWPAVHRLDAARLFRLAVESAPAGSRLHGVAEEGIPVREIAEAIGRGLGQPVRSIAVAEAQQHFGFLGPVFALDCPASSKDTQALLGWSPVQPGLIADLDSSAYFDTALTHANH